MARIRLIKRLQAKRYYPLAVIRPLLRKMERAKDPETEMDFLESLYRPLAYDPHFVPLDAEQLAARTGLTPSEIARLGEMSLLIPSTNGDALARYDEDDLKVAELVSQELRSGARLEDFAAYAAATRALVREEFELFRKLRGENKPSPERVRELKEAADLVHALLRAKLTRQMLVRIKHGEAEGWPGQLPPTGQSGEV